ncbi:MAG TPA: alpha/beta fold hydrolase [Burkholderiales bacterium]
MTDESLPFVLVPGLGCSARVFAEQIPMLWRFGPVTVADHKQGDSIETIARQMLSSAPPRFGLIGFSMGGYIAFEMHRQAPQRIAALALVDTSARPETPAQTTVRRQRIAQARAGRFREAMDEQFALLVHKSRATDAGLKRIYDAMLDDTGVQLYIRHQEAIMQRADSRPDLARVRCPTLVLVGDDDKITPPEGAREMAEGIKGARFVVVPECGHFTFIERPDAVSAALAEWAQLIHHA